MTAFALASVLAFLSGLHIYWALGGRWGWGAAIPQVDGRPAFTPSRFATLLVALGLAAAAVLPLVVPARFPSRWPRRCLSGRPFSWRSSFSFALSATSDSSGSSSVCAELPSPSGTHACSHHSASFSQWASHESPPCRSSPLHRFVTLNTVPALFAAHRPGSRSWGLTPACSGLATLAADARR
jgi:hypothetical protein